MTVTYKCNDPPRRDIEEFVEENMNRGRETEQIECRKRTKFRPRLHGTGSA